MIVLKIRSYSARSDLKNKSARFSGNCSSEVPPSPALQLEDPSLKPSPSLPTLPLSLPSIPLALFAMLWEGGGPGCRRGGGGF